MGILSDFFVAISEDARRYATSGSHKDAALKTRIAPAEYKGFTTVELGTLWAILEGKDWDVVRHALADESLEGEGESWLFRLPDGLVGLLATANDETLAKANVEWASTEELDCPPADLVPVVRDLQRLAKRARATGNPMYLWVSL